MVCPILCLLRNCLCKPLVIAGLLWAIELSAGLRIPKKYTLPRQRSNRGRLRLQAARIEKSDNGREVVPTGLEISSASKISLEAYTAQLRTFRLPQSLPQGFLSR